MIPVSLSQDRINQFRKGFAGDPEAKLLQNALTGAELSAVAVDREILNAVDPSMSQLIDDWPVTDQHKSGRCWLFAGLNLLRSGVIERLKIKDFEFSQNYAMFFDKIERSNYFLQAIIATAERPADDRTVATLLTECVSDGGQWNMFAALIDKHGLVPKYAMPETKSSENTAPMNASLRSILRTAARDLRRAHADDRQAIAESVLETVWRALCMHLGTPPERFLWQWTDSDREFHRTGWVSPQQFRDSVLDQDVNDYVCLVHDPRPSSPYGRTFTVEMLGNVVGGAPVTYLNVEMPIMKKLATDQLLGGTPVWFGCDVAKQLDRDAGVWDAKLFDLEAIYRSAFDLDKADRLEYHETLMTHAMLFTGIDIVEGSPRRWRVENSWGSEHGIAGYYTMNDSWFDEYVFEIAAPRRSLPAELVAALKQEPLVLPAWDPMGALAR